MAEAEYAPARIAQRNIEAPFGCDSPQTDACLAYSTLIHPKILWPDPATSEESC